MDLFRRKEDKATESMKRITLRYITKARAILKIEDEAPIIDEDVSLAGFLLRRADGFYRERDHYDPDIDSLLAEAIVYFRKKSSN